MAEPADKSAEGAPAEAAVPLEPVVKKKMIEAGHAGAHGGAWKIALADMMTAMMAFFLLMWLLGATTEDQRKSIADYFKPMSHSMASVSKLAGTGGIMGGNSITDPDGMPYAGQQTSLFERETPRLEGGKQSGAGDSKDEKNDMNPNELSEAEKQRIAAENDKKNFDKLEKEVKEKMQQNPRLDKIKDQVKFIREKDGLRIEVIDKADFSMFGLGNARMDPKALTLIREVAKSVAGMPNKIAIRGHTDSLAYDDGVRSNWSLSGDRAESTRHIMKSAGIPDSRFDKIEGVADTAPYIPNNPADPRNRRISITVQFQGGPAS
jgi:chemotaxis protein MotB